MNFAKKATDFKLHFIGWARLCIIGSMFGIGIAASPTLFTYYSLNYPQTLAQSIIFWKVTALAGAFGGSVYGYFQYRALRRMVTTLNCKRWMMHSAIGLMIGWIVAVFPFVFIANPELSYTKPQTVSGLSFEQFALIAMSSGLPAGLILGTAQWFILRKYYTQSKLWIIANGIGWSIGMIFIYLTGTIVDKYTASPIIIIMAAFGGELAGKMVALSTALALKLMQLKIG